MQVQNVNPNKLYDELQHAGIGIMSAENDQKDGEQIAHNMWLKFAEGTDMDLVQQIIDAHDPTPLPQPLTEIEVLKQEKEILAQSVYDLTLIIEAMLTGGIEE